MAEARGAILDVQRVSLSFGELVALNDINLSVERETVHSIIGPNGAGKTSLLNCLSGLYRPQEGQVILDTKTGTRQGRNDLLTMPSHKMGRLGLARTFQNLELFPHMSVVDNLLLGRHIYIRPRLFGALVRSPAVRRDEAANREKVNEVIDFLGLGEVADAVAGELAYGIQKQVELARALSLEPELLLLDEPMAGTTGAEREAITESIRTILESGVTVVMIEHDMSVVMALSDTVTVLSFGTVISEGPPEVVAADPEVIEAYLGEPAE